MVVVDPCNCARACSNSCSVMTPISFNRLNFNNSFAGSFSQLIAP
jgi:hypothetical protein